MIQKSTKIIKPNGFKNWVKLTKVKKKISVLLVTKQY